MRTRIIAEVASNHGGDLALAKEFIRVAADAGADYVKFQSWRVSTMRDGTQDAQYDWFSRSELSDAAHVELIDECHRRGIRFLTTCFDIGRVEFIASLGLTEVKVASPDLASERMLRALRTHFEHVIVSAGMGSDDEVRIAAQALAGGRFTLLHCVSLYPMPADAAQLKRMQWLRQFTPSVGWSDHAPGTKVVKLAIALGADFVEKHLCLGPEGPGQVTAWDATPAQLAEIVEYARFVEAAEGDEALPITPTIDAARTRFIGRFGNNA